MPDRTNSQKVSDKFIVKRKYRTKVSYLRAFTKQFFVLDLSKQRGGGVHFGQISPLDRASFTFPRPFDFPVTSYRFHH